MQDISDYKAISAHFHVIFLTFPIRKMQNHKGKCRALWSFLILVWWSQGRGLITPIYKTNPIMTARKGAAIRNIPERQTAQCKVGWWKNNKERIKKHDKRRIVYRRFSHFSITLQCPVCLVPAKKADVQCRNSEKVLRMPEKTKMMVHTVSSIFSLLQHGRQG